MRRGVNVDKNCANEQESMNAKQAGMLQNKTRKSNLNPTTRLSLN